MAKKKDVTKLHGMSIYHDEKQRVIYSPWFTKKGYILHDQNVSEYQNYSQSYLIAIIVLLVIYYFTHNIIYALILAICYEIISILVFYIRCLKKVPIFPDFKKPEKENYIVRQAKNIETKRIVVIIIACVCLALYILFNALYQQYTGNTLLMNYGFIALSLLFGLLYLVILIYKKKNNL